MINRFKTYIEKEPWDEWLLQNEDVLNRICLAIVILAACYFAPVCLKAFLR